MKYNMLSKQKKLCKSRKIDTSNIFHDRGLFVSKESKEHLLQDLRKGVLFLFQPHREEPNPQKDNKPVMEEQNWLNSIKVEIQETNQKTYDINSSILSNDLQSKQLPAIVLKKKQSNKKEIEQKCNKAICFEKKLKTLGAWNKQNKNGIDPCIDRLAIKMGKPKCRLIQNDFTRITGMSFRDDSNYEKSINADLSMNETNPFANLSIFSITDSGFQKARSSKLWLKMKRKRIFQSQGDSVPSFLLKTLSVDRLFNKKNLKF